MGFESITPAGSISNEDLEKEKLEKERLERQAKIRGYIESVKDGSWKNQPDRFRDQGAIITVRDGDKNLGHIDVSYEYKDNQRYISAVDGGILDQFNEQGENIGFERYDSSGDLQYSHMGFKSEGTYTDGEKTLDKDGRVVSIGGVTKGGPGSMVREYSKEYYDHGNLAGKIIETTHFGQDFRKETKFFGPDGSELDVEGYEWERRMSELEHGQIIPKKPERAE